MDAPSSDDTARALTSASELGFLLLAGTALLGGLLVVSGPTLPPPADDHPLPACSAPTNCVRTSRTYAVPASRLYRAARQALQTLEPTALRRPSDSLRASAVYRVGLVFKDDVTVVVAPGDGTSTLHLRSESRVGLYDFEVNRRRVQNLLDAVEAVLPRTPVQPR